MDMQYLIIKYLATAGVVVLVSEFARRSDRLGGLIAALPLVTVLTLIWLHLEQQPTARLSNHAYYTFWYVIPTLPMFLLFPWLLQKTGFWAALLCCVIFTAGLFWCYAAVLRKFGITLL
jgi:F0F1-type ATP synthase assembly protein I